jgi:hypothetical protein
MKEQNNNLKTSLQSITYENLLHTKITLDNVRIQRDLIDKYLDDFFDYEGFMNLSYFLEQQYMSIFEDVSFFHPINYN